MPLVVCQLKGCVALFISCVEVDIIDVEELLPKQLKQLTGLGCFFYWSRRRGLLF